METIEYRDVVDKSGWERGPWDDEPDKIQWPDEATGLPCLIVRGPVGALCGYVGVPAGHPWHGVDWDGVEPYPAVHGGLTFAGACSHEDRAWSICHDPGGGADDVWWLGFDCAHAGDYTSMSSPARVRRLFPHLGDTYRPIAYVRGQVTKLARQAAEAAASRSA